MTVLRRAMWPLLATVMAFATAGAAGVAAAQPPLEALPYILQLQLSQHPAWRAYKDAAAESHADGAHAASRAALLNAMSTPQRLDALRTEMQEQQRTFERQAAATEAFYAELSPEQKRTFDEVTAIPPPRYPQNAPRAQAAQSAAGPSVLRAPPPGAALTPPTP